MAARERRERGRRGIGGGALTNYPFAVATSAIGKIEAPLKLGEPGLLDEEGKEFVAPGRHDSASMQAARARAQRQAAAQRGRGQVALGHQQRTQVGDRVALGGRAVPARLARRLQRLIIQLRRAGQVALG